MSQNDFNIANQGFPSFRSDLNSALQALASTSSGETEPSPAYANQLWYDTAENVLKIRNEANSAWLDALSALGVTATAAELNQLDTNTFTSQIKVDQITDEAGTGAPEFPNGILAAAGVPSYQYVSTVQFTASGTFGKATYPWLRAVRVRCQGGGAGGGGSSTTNRSLGGGGGGGYAESFITNIAGLASSVTVTVGAGGDGGAADASSNNGTEGGASSFGSLVIAAGGGTGAGASGGSGGSSNTGDLVVGGGGAGGGSGTNTPSIAGIGGSSVLGGGGAALGDATTSTVGRDGQLYGGGGSGGRNASAGGNGAAGIVIVELFA